MDTKQAKAKESKKFSFEMPSSFTVLFLIIIVLAILTWIIPAGQYQTNEAGQLIAGTYEVVESTPRGFYDVLMSPVYGMYGTETTGAAIEVALFIWVMGGFLGVLDYTGALDVGIASVIKKNRGNEKKLIPLLMLLFALGGSTYGMAEETIAFYPLLIPIMVTVGFDTLVAVAIVLVGSQVGCLASTVNPFATGVASDAAGISIGDGFFWRLVFFVVMLGVSILFVYRYAEKVQKHPEESLVADQREENLEHFQVPERVPELSKKQRNVLIVFGLTFVIMILGLIPWADFGITIFESLNDALLQVPILGGFMQHADPLGSWYFAEITMLFLAMSVLMGIVYGISEKDFVSTFMKGTADMNSVALICAVSRGVQIIMNDGQITATVLHWGEISLANLPAQAFIALTYLFYLPMSFLIPGTSSLAGATMGLLGPLGEFAGVGAHLVITAFQAASGVLNLVTPTSGVVMGALAIARIDLTTWWKFMGKLVVTIILLSIVILVVASYF